MKSVILISLLAAFAIASTSCSTAIPVDPNTGKLSWRCMPQNVPPPGP